MNKRILVIEDDQSIAEIERDFLELGGFQVTIASDGPEGLRLAMSEEYALVLLDIMLPGMDGLAVCEKIRASLDIPVLMLTARAEDRDKIRGLALGADDYITKPFSPAELVARVRANLAQYERLTAGSVRKEKAVLRAGRISIMPESRRVFAGEQPVELTNKEYELLLFLMQHPDKVFSKETLYERIWGENFYGDLKTVAVHIGRLREKIEQNPANPTHIQTVWGAGYRFSA